MMNSTVASRKKRRQEKGFTLVETASALLVMMIGGLGICAVFAYAIKNNTGSRDRALAMAVAQQQMERYRQMKFIDAALTAQGPTTQTITSADERTYSVTTTITNTTTSLKTIKIQVTPLMSQGLYALGTVEISVQRSTFELGIYQGA